VSECKKWVVERGWERGNAFVVCVCEVLVGGLGGHESVVEEGSGEQLEWVSTSLLMYALLILRLA